MESLHSIHFDIPGCDSDRNAICYFYYFTPVSAVLLTLTSCFIHSEQRVDNITHEQGNLLFSVNVATWATF